jgi:hypothetical protein
MSSFVNINFSKEKTALQMQSGFVWQIFFAVNHQ